jgi:hypothetical protein
MPTSTLFGYGFSGTWSRKRRASGGTASRVSPDHFASALPHASCIEATRFSCPRFLKW